MRKVILGLLSVLLISCGSVQLYEDNNIDVIRYKRFNVMRYDWVADYELKEGYCVYYKKTSLEIITNHIYGDFEIITYLEYNKMKEESDQ